MYSNLIPRNGEPANASISAKKAKQRRPKNPYSDAEFRPFFQALIALDWATANGWTSVTYATPSHSTNSIIKLQVSETPSIILDARVAAEELTDKEESRSARFWRQYGVELPHLPKRRRPAAWRDLSDVASLEWFHYAMRTLRTTASFSLNLSPEVELQVRKEKNAAKWLSCRMARRLKQTLGRPVEFWFAFEVSDDRRLHIHGELQVEEDALDRARKALRLAGGEWKAVRQHQAHTGVDPSVVWANYCAKDSIFIRPLAAGPLSRRTRPIEGDWLFATNSVRSHAARLYEARRKQVVPLLGN